MAIELSEEVINAINDADSIKVLASVDRHGRIHVVAKGSITVDASGRLKYWELLEGSQTNKNVTYALWFDKEIAINVITKNKNSYQIKGIPRVNLNAGKEYQKEYVRAQNRNPKNDLAAVYFIEPIEVINESYDARYDYEREKNPLYIHLDRIAK